jgi:hypothetical protein
MSNRESFEEIIDKTEEAEKRFDWITAANLLKQALTVTDDRGLLNRGKVQEKIGFCLHKAAFQAESKEKFEQAMHQSIEAYEKALQLHEKSTDEKKSASIPRCKAIIKYLSYWLTTDPSERRRFLDESLEFEETALEVLSKSGEILQYGRLYNELSLVFSLRGVLEWNPKALRAIVEKGKNWGEKAISVFSEIGNFEETAMTECTLANCLIDLGYYFISEPEDRDKNRLDAVAHLNKAVEFSKKTGNTYVLGLSHILLGENTGGEESTEHLEKALECGKQTKDNFLIAKALDYPAEKIYWKALGTEDPEKRRELAEKAMQLYDESQHYYSIIAFMTSRGGVISPPNGYAEYYLHLAMFETDHEKRLKFLKKAEKAGTDALTSAENSGMPTIVWYVNHVASKILEAEARLDTNPVKKQSLLEKALKYRQKTIEISDLLFPFDYFNRGVSLNYLSEIMLELADIKTDSNEKTKLLEEVASIKEKCLTLCYKMTPYFEKVGELQPFAALYWYQDSYATLLTHIWSLTNLPKHLERAIEVSKKAIESASKLDMVSLMAESYWKIAKAQDSLSEHLQAAENFKTSSQTYLKAAEKIPQLKDFFQDYALYVDAWYEIENARFYHTEKEYSKAKEHYERSAELHKSTRRWNYLTHNYLAWALLEKAEDLSRKEQTEDAKNHFEQAANLFGETRKSVEDKLGEIAYKDEKKMATELVKASNTRKEYCHGRIALEEAKILDRQGKYVESSKKYRLATETFKKIAEVESEQSRQEFQPIIHLCQAWEKMMMAEAKASSTLYGEAAELFKQAKEHTFDQPTSLLALANSSFCKALEAGTEFESSRSIESYSTAKKHIEAAANYYLKAGFMTASEYAKATQHVFDAYMYINKAETEASPGEKAQYYQIAEKLLQASADSYVKAQHHEKGEEVQRLIESVKEEQKLAISLSEILHTPPAASTTTSFSTPTQTYERAVGLERFEHADIQASLILKEKEIKIDEDLDLEIELINSGKAPALLIKVAEVTPEEFEIRKGPDIYRIEDRYLNMKGRKLDPLKTDEIKLVIKPLSKGMFTLKPRILYLDETGKYRSCEPDPVSITVKELGIKGWIRGKK